MRGSFEDAGGLVDGLGPELEVLVLQLLRSPVQGLGDQPALRHFTLQSKHRRKLSKHGVLTLPIKGCAGPPPGRPPPQLLGKRELALRGARSLAADS